MLTAITLRIRSRTRGFRTRAQKVSEKARRLLRRITEDKLVSTLAALIEKERNCIFMHSSLSACGHIVGGESSVIGAVGRFCETFCLPTHTYCYPKGSPPVVPVYDPRTTGSVVGQITDYFWRQPGIVRSVHPTHSLAARGPRAKDLVEGHGVCETPCGSGTPYARLIDWNCSVLMFGATMGTYTLFHTAEDEAGCDYLYWKDPFDLKVCDYSGNERDLRMWRHDMRVPRRFADMDKVFESQGYLKGARLGRGELLFIPSAQEAHRFLLERLKADPYYLVAGQNGQPGGN